jgi:predicted Fe-S protein YdhL (DUF1289 family)
MIQSPCISKCEMGKDYICKGCFRKIGEIDNWISLSEDEKKEIISLARVRKAKKLGQDYYGSFPG